MDQKHFSCQFPEIDSIRQGEEYFVLKCNGKEERIGFHDYDRLYEVPGLYEYLFYDRYKCKSPQVVCSLLEKQLDRSSADISELCVLDIGAGNGMVGEQLVEMGAESVVGIDIIEEAAKAAERDRPEIYDDYYVADLTELPDPLGKELEEKNFNCMTVVAALGFGDIPPLAFAGGYNLISSPGWVAFNIKDEFFSKKDSTGFTKLIRRMLESDVLKLETKHRYRHRFCLDGTPLYYYAMVGSKQADISDEMLNDLI